MGERSPIDAEHLRAALIGEARPAAFVASPWAIVDVAKLEETSPEELIHEAERRGCTFEGSWSDDMSFSEVC